MKVRTTKIHKLCVYSFPHCIPNAIKNFFISTGELSKEEDVLEWLIENKSTGDDEEIIEDVTAKTLHTLIGNVDNLVVLFCKYILVFPTCHCIFFVPSMQKRKKNSKGTSKEPRNFICWLVNDWYTCCTHTKTILTHCHRFRWWNPEQESALTECWLLNSFY